MKTVKHWVSKGGLGVVNNHSYFDKVVKQLFALIGETTEHGQVFRMDLALRPNGESGHSVLSLDALETYFQVQGREWERLAWLKARVVAPASRMGQVKALRDIVTPFVFRRYLDYNVFEALRVLHQQIRAQSRRLSAGRPERANDVKLGRGGIREIEFTVQLLQVVRGGQFPELRRTCNLGHAGQSGPCPLNARQTPRNRCTRLMCSCVA
jgi:glutamate-ammonia-ligase adenylyltransferase